MSNIWTITKRELAGYFNSPVAYVFLVIFLLMTGAFTFLLTQFIENKQATLRMFFYWHPWLYLFLVPAVGMRLWSEERRLGAMAQETGDRIGAFVEFVAAFSVIPNVEQFNDGQIDSRSIIYFLSVIGFPLFATNVIIRGLRA